MTAPQSHRPTLSDDDTLAYIEIDYEPQSEDPARVFRAMALLIDAFYEIDRDLVGVVSATIEPVLVLDRIEEGSIRAYLRTVLRELDDDALKHLDWKPLLGQYLVRGKHALLRWLDKQETVPTRAEVQTLQRELQQITPPPQPGQLLLPGPVSAERIYRDAQRITDAIAVLREGDRVSYVSAETTSRVNPPIELSDEDVELALTEEIITAESEVVLLVKKPDYLGNSKWEFRSSERALEAKMSDSAWLERFKAGAIALRPGDSLRVRLRSELLRGFEGNVVGTRHEVLKVLRIVRAGELGQIQLLQP